MVLFPSYSTDNDKTVQVLKKKLKSKRWPIISTRHDVNIMDHIIIIKYYTILLL